jgi:hypothetical protein
LNKKVVFKVQGKEQLWNKLSTDVDAFDELQSCLTVKEDTSIQKIYPEENDEDVGNLMDMMENVSENFVEKEKTKKKK